MTFTDDAFRERLDTSVPVIVLSRRVGPFQHCPLAIARSLGRLGVPVYTMRDQKSEPTAKSRYVREALAFPPIDGDDALLESLLGLADRLGDSILLPIDDLAAVFVGDHQEQLSERFLLPAAPAGVQRRLASKRELWRLCQKLDLPTPVSTFPESESELLEQAEAHGYPVVVKRAEPWFASRDPAAPSVAIAADRAQLLDAYARMESDIEPQVMLQQYIPGGSESVWMFNGYVGDGATCLCAFTGRKLRQAGPGTGPTTLGICEENREVMALAERLLRALDYRGIVDMGFRHDSRDGAYKLLDVNPRLGSTFRLFVSEDGLDVVRALHLHLTGRSVPPSRVAGGRKWLDERTDAVTSFRMARLGMLGLRSWALPLRGVNEGAWWAADDPQPFWSMAAAFGPHALRRLADRTGVAGRAKA